MAAVPQPTKSDGLALLGLLFDDNENMIFCSRPGGKDSEFDHHATTSTMDGLDWCHRRNLPNRRFGYRSVYVKIGIYDGTWVPTEGVNKTTGKPYSSTRPALRTENILGSRALVLDIDGHSGGYPTTDAAISAVQLASPDLLRVMPPASLCNLTGGGVHLVWIAETPWPAAQWQHYSKALHNLARRIGLKTDTFPITKGLRIVGDGLVNYNHVTPRDTKALIPFDDPTSRRIPNAALEQALNPSGNVVDFRTGRPVVSEYDTTTDWLLDEAAPGCAVVKHIQEGPVSDFRADRWVRAVQIIMSTLPHDRTTAIQQAEDWSDQDDEYIGDPRRYDRLRSFEASIHPPRCTTLAVDFPEHCGSCPFLERAQSPKSVPGWVQMVPTAPIETPFQSNPAAPTANPSPAMQVVSLVLPNTDYLNNAKGLWFKPQGADEAKMVWPSINVTDMHRVANLETRHHVPDIAFWINRPGELDKRKYIQLGVSDTENSATLSKRLSVDYGTTLGVGHQVKVQQAMVSFVESLRNVTPRTAAVYNRLGWCEDGFVMPRMLYTATGTRLIQTEPALEAFKAEGDPAVQTDVLNQFLTLDRRGVSHVHMAASLSAPLFYLIDLTGFMFSFWSSETALGKTTITKLAAGLWCNPQTITGTVNDTEAAMIARLARNHNLPMLFDENRSKIEEVTRMLYRLSGGMERARLSQTAKLLPAGLWVAPMLVAGNRSIMQMIRLQDAAQDTALARFMEFRYRMIVGGLASMAMDSLLLPLRGNYGHVGRAFVALLLGTRAAVIDRLRAKAEALEANAAVTRYDLGGRFHIKASAALIVTAELASESGILGIDPILVHNEVIGVLAGLREARSEAQRSERWYAVIQQFLQHHSARMIHYSSDNPSGPHTSRPERTPIVYAINHRQGTLEIDLHELQAFAESRHISSSDLLAELRRQGCEIKANGILGHRTNYHVVPRSRLLIDCSKRWSDGTDFSQYLRRDPVKLPKPEAPTKPD